MKTRYSCFVLSLLVMCFLMGCASNRSAMKNVSPFRDFQTNSGVGESEDPPKLVLTSMQRTGFVPMRVTFRVQLRNVSPTDEAWACLEQAWNFGDGSISAERPNCVGITPHVETEYLMDHVYTRNGAYSIRFSLGGHLSNAVSIQVLDNGQNDM